MPLDVAKVFVCGDQGIGKTTLIETLTSQRHLEAHEQPPDEPDKPDERTAGIKLSQLNLICGDAEGSVEQPVKRPKMAIPAAPTATLRVFDFGGQPAFHVIHTLLVSDWTAAFVVCVDLSKSHEELKQSLWYWLRFIATRVKQSRETLFASELQDYDAIDKRPRVILVGTKADKCHASHGLNTKDGSTRRLAGCIHNAVSAFSSVLNVVTSESLIALNCFRSWDSGFEALHQQLRDHAAAIKGLQLVVPRIVSEVSTALGTVRKETVLPMSVDEVLVRVRAVHDGFSVMGDELTLELFRASLRWVALGRGRGALCT